MFRIGEFAQIAQVSGRLLRYYDRIGLLGPAHADPATGYRYYSARQLPRLNRILALKELGLSLEQIAGLVDEEIAAERLRDMLTVKKAEVEQSLAAEAARLRQIESRIRQIDVDGVLAAHDVVVKSVPARPWLSLRRTVEDMDEAVALVGGLARAAAPRLKGWENLTVLSHSGFDAAGLDLQAGFTLARPQPAPRLPDGLALQPDELPAVDEMATLVRSGPPHEAHLAFGALGLWMEGHGYAIAGPCREVFLELPDPASGALVLEIQYPVSRAGPAP